MSATKFINHSEILDTIRYAAENANNRHLVDAILDKAKDCRGLTHREAAVLLESTDPEVTERVKDLARDIKKRFYGNRIVMFAPPISLQLLRERMHILPLPRHQP